MDHQKSREAETRRPRYSDEFRRDAVRLVVEESYSFAAAARAVGVCDQTLRSWHAKLAPPPQPIGDDATLEQVLAENKRLRKELKRAEMKREIP
jgi:transposase